MENKMQDSKRGELKKMVNEYQGNCFWEAEGWGDNVPSEEDLEKELESILDYFDSEISKAREEGRKGVLEDLIYMFFENLHADDCISKTMLLGILREELSKLSK